MFARTTFLALLVAVSSDATSDATAQTLVADMTPGTGSTIFSSSVTIGDRCYIYTRDGLWRSNGTAAGTQLILPGISISGDIVAFGNQLVMQVRDATLGSELGVFDVPTEKLNVFDLNPGTSSSAPGYFRVAGDKLFFRCNDGVHGIEPWATDGTRTGTTLLVDIQTGSFNGGPESFTEYEGRCYFFGLGDFYVSDGTPSGTTRLPDGFTSIDNGRSPLEPLARVGSRFVFEGSTATVSNEPCYFDVATGANGLLKDLDPQVSSLTAGYVAAGGYVWFRGNTSTAGQELWRTDGTPAGTVLFADLVAGTASSKALPHSACGDRLLFFATDATNARGLWTTDGTTAGTSVLLPMASTNVSIQQTMQGVGQRVLFSYEATSFAGHELVLSDGTLTGTLMITSKSIVDASSNSVFHGFLGKQLLFSGRSAATGIELWSTDLTRYVRTAGPTHGTTLTSLDPTLNSTWKVSGARSPAGSVSVVILGAPASVPFGSTSYTGVVHHDPAVWFQLAVGAWSSPFTLDVPIPNDSALDGAWLTMQAWDFVPNGPGWDIVLGNGLHAVLGS
ncbi:MAG: hypothetical protein KDC95_15000 [Planctomycetes bacterium]|nr:hypothetical protein [Planctomycetota bacterium]